MSEQTAVSIKLRNVSKIYQLERSSHQAVTDRKIAVDSVSLDIRSGERVGIVGPNGAGKTTMLQMLSGIIEPTSGRIDIQGRVTCVMTLGVGLREEATGRENIYLDGETLGYSRARIDGYLEEVVEFAELEDFIDRPVRTYSTGMKSRLAFSMLIAADPEILVIDEALSAGDIFFAKKAARKMRQLTASGKIVIVVSHGLEAIVNMCDRCLWMEDGKIRADGEAETVTQAYHEKNREESLREWRKKNLAHSGEWSLGSEWGLTGVQYMQAGEAVSPNSVSTGKPTRLTFQVTKPLCASARLAFRIEKADGFCVEETELATLEESSFNKRRGGIEFTPLLLASGKYLIEITLSDDRQCTARLNSIFEVDAPKQDGGEPLIISPPRIRVSDATAGRV